MSWFKKKLLCAKCNSHKTKREFEGEPTCQSCEFDILMRRENKRICPVDQSYMNKEVVEGTELIIDRCPNCKGVWLDSNELEELSEEISSGNASGLAVGLALGVAIG